MFSTSKFIIKIKLIYTNLFKPSLSPAFYTGSLSDLPVKTIISVIYLNSPALLPDFQLHWHLSSFHPSTQSYSLSCSKFFDTEMSPKISWRLCGSRFSSVASGTCCQDPACTTHTWTCRWLAPLFRPALLPQLACDGAVPLTARSLLLPALVSPLAPLPLGSSWPLVLLDTYL